MKKLTDLYVSAHDNISEKVEEHHIQRVINDAKNMLKLCFMPVGTKAGGYAVAHQQITKKPLTFFVTKHGDIIINPKIIKHTNHTVDHEEGCLTFPNNLPVIVQRWHKCIVKFKTLNDEKELTNWIEKDVSGMEAYIFQHEIDHFNCKYVY